MKLAVVTLLCTSMLAAACEVQACRPRIVDPVQWMGDPGRPFQITEVFVGEVVSTRDAARLKELDACAARTGNRSDAYAICQLEKLDLGSNVYEIEVVPLEVLLGEPDRPARVQVSGCLVRPPRIGAEALIFVTSEGWATIRLRQGDETGFPTHFDDAYLERVRRCAKGDCGEDMDP